MLPTKYWFIWPNGFRGEAFYKSTNQKQELPVAAMLVSGLGPNEQYYLKTYQVSVHLAKLFQRRRFLEINQSETRIFCGGHVY
jgi:hypothetical protein